jgi:hypothetical protein
MAERRKFLACQRSSPQAPVMSGSPLQIIRGRSMKPLIFAAIERKHSLAKIMRATDVAALWGGSFAAGLPSRSWQHSRHKRESQPSPSYGGAALKAFGAGGEGS